MTRYLWTALTISSNGFDTPGEKLYITAHPERWSANLGEWLVWSFLDFGMNVGKVFLQRNKA